MVEFRAILVFSLVLFFLRRGCTLTCYSCSASIGHSAPCENITNHLMDISHHECFHSNAVCAIYKIEYGNNVMIYRSCKEAGVCLALSKKFNSQYNRVLDCKTCNDEDLCNSAYSKLPSFLLAVSFLIVLFYNYKRC